MATFDFERLTGQDDRAFVEVDGKYQVVVIRTDEGIVVDVYPKDWDFPVETFTVWDDDVTELNRQAEAS